MNSLGLERKVITIGNSQGVTLPKGWIESIERKHSIQLTKILMEVSDKIIISPLIIKKEQTPKLKNETQIGDET